MCCGLHCCRVQTLEPEQSSPHQALLLKSLQSLQVMMLMLTVFSSDALFASTQVSDMAIVRGWWYWIITYMVSVK